MDIVGLVSALVYLARQKLVTRTSDLGRLAVSGRALAGVFAALSTPGQRGSRLHSTAHRIIPFTLLSATNHKLPVSDFVTLSSGSL